MKVLICGDRQWNQSEPIKRELAKLPVDSIIIHGACVGADSLGGYLARRMGFEVKEYPANWQKYKKAAGPIRNQEMLDKNPDIDLVLAFHEHIEESKGTAHMIKIAKKINKIVKLIEE